MDFRQDGRSFRTAGFWFLAMAAVAMTAASAGHAQEMRSSDRMRGKVMLKTIKKELEKNYYDPTFHGLDLEARFLKADQAIDQATSLSHMLGIIAQAVVDLNDSHTRFIPPSRVGKIEYGWRMRVVGETPYIIAVRPGSDAEGKGLKTGDKVLSIDGFSPNRRNNPIFKYRYYLVRPVPGMSLVVQSPGGSQSRLDIETRIETGKRVVDLTQGEDIWDILRQAENSSDVYRLAESEDKSVLIWNIPSFTGDEEQLKDVAGRLSKYKSVILDLRGNSGGYVKRLSLLLGYFFDHDVTVGQPKGRDKGLKPIIAKTQGPKAFNGQLAVLVDSDSGSAAELFARVIQIEKRGTVFGDRTAGAVMQARNFSKEMGGETLVLYGISITISEIIMKDGGSLEGVGVVPDILALPTGEDLAAGRDPVLCRAAAAFGAPMSPEAAGKLFPYRWAD